jgi:hypothetical protein
LIQKIIDRDEWPWAFVPEVTSDFTVIERGSNKLFGRKDLGGDKEVDEV